MSRRPLVRFAVCAVLLCVGFGCARVIASQDKKDEFIEISGKRSPELIPDWLAWQQLFRNIALVADKPSGLAANLVLTDADKDLLAREASAQKPREAECVRMMEALRASLGDAKPEDVRAATIALSIKCRQATLDARDRLRDSLSPGAFASLIRLSTETRAGITSHVRPSDLEWFRRPQ